jgi:cysteinyl-tRNA synthetase
MPSRQPEETAQQELRHDLVVEVDQAIVKVCDLVSQLNEREKAYMNTQSVVYRQLVNTIAAWASSR